MSKHSKPLHSVIELNDVCIFAPHRVAVKLGGFKDICDRPITDEDKKGGHEAGIKLARKMFLLLLTPLAFTFASCIVYVLLINWLSTHNWIYIISLFATVVTWVLIRKYPDPRYAQLAKWVFWGSLYCNLTIILFFTTSPVHLFEVCAASSCFLVSLMTYLRSSKDKLEDKIDYSVSVPESKPTEVLNEASESRTLYMFFYHFAVLVVCFLFEGDFWAPFFVALVSGLIDLVLGYLVHRVINPKQAQPSSDASLWKDVLKLIL